MSGDVPYQDTTACTIELTNNLGDERASIYWPTLISTANFTASFTVAMSSGSNPADGFTMILADPSQGATTSSIGTLGEGLGAAGMRSVAGWDTYQNGNDNGGALENNCSANTLNGACDPITVPYMAVGYRRPKLWENPWAYVNGSSYSVQQRLLPTDIRQRDPFLRNKRRRSYDRDHGRLSVIYRPGLVTAGC